MRIFNFQFSIFKLLSISYTLLAICLFFYSFTQVDLGLTLTQWSVWKIFQTFFQHIGFFERPLSTYFYSGILVLLFIFYAIFLRLSYLGQISRKQFWQLIIPVSIILLFAYNAFSYDLFNYIFDAKIVTFYHQNPYFHHALEYAGNPMLGFMHWTQRNYPYGPIWLLAIIPFSFSGFKLLLPTMIAFKAIEWASFLGTIYFSEKIQLLLSPKKSIFGLSLFAFNPLVLIEALVSAHNDMFMMFLSVFAFYLILQKKYITSFLALLFSIGVKFATVFLAPFYIILGYFTIKKKTFNPELFFTVAAAFMILPIVVASVRTNFQPWYLLYVLPFAALSQKKYFVVIPVVILSFFSLLEYIPFLYTGNWNNPIPSILNYLQVSGIVFSVFIVFLIFLRSRFVKK